VTEPSTALAQYNRSMRRKRTIYYAIVAVVVIAVGTFAGVVYSSGEVAHTSLHTIDKAPGTVAIQAPSPNQQLAWKTSDRLAIGKPQWRGTIITFSNHTVGGRDATTGKRTWSYTRTNRTVCTAAQVNGTTIAIYQNRGNCDEVSAFYSDTGKRRWTRTLDKDGMPVNGVPTYQMTDFTFMVTSPTVIYAIDPVSGLDRWTYDRAGCRIGETVLGTAGALISQNCTKPQCKDVKFCGRGPQVFLRDGVSGNGDDNKPNADQIKWNRIGDGELPVSADQLIATADRTTHVLSELAQDTGVSLRTIALKPVPTTLQGAVAEATSTDEVLWVDGRTYAIRPGTARPVWVAKTPSAPTIVSTTNQDPPVLATARISVATSTGIAVLDGNGGRLLQRFAVPPPTGGGLVYPLGTGFLVADASGVVAYR
jgi:hypothetical protein